jgi:hypothetical protein
VSPWGVVALDGALRAAGTTAACDAASVLTSLGQVLQIVHQQGQLAFDGELAPV